MLPIWWKFRRDKIGNEKRYQFKKFRWSNWKPRRPTTKQQLPISRQDEDNSEYEQHVKLKTKFRTFKIMTPVNNNPRKRVDW